MFLTSVTSLLNDKYVKEKDLHICKVNLNQLNVLILRFHRGENGQLFLARGRCVTEGICFRILSFRLTEAQSKCWKLCCCP